MSFWGSSMLTRWNTWGSESLWLRSLFLSWGQQINPSQGVFSGSSLPAFPVHVWLYTCPCQWLWAWALFVFLTCLSVPLKEEGLAVVWPLAGLVFPGPCWPMGKSPLPFQNLYTAKHKTEITCLVLLEILLPTLLDWFFRCPEMNMKNWHQCLHSGGGCRDPAGSCRTVGQHADPGTESQPQTLALCEQPHSKEEEITRVTELTSSILPSWLVWPKTGFWKVSQESCPFLPLRRVERISSLDSIRSWRYFIINYFIWKILPCV